MFLGLHERVCEGHAALVTCTHSWHRPAHKNIFVSVSTKNETLFMHSVKCVIAMMWTQFPRWGHRIKYGVRSLLPRKGWEPLDKVMEVHFVPRWSFCLIVMALSWMVTKISWWTLTHGKTIRQTWRPHYISNIYHLYRSDFDVLGLTNTWLGSGKG